MFHALPCPGLLLGEKDFHSRFCGNEVKEELPDNHSINQKRSMALPWPGGASAPATTISAKLRCALFEILRWAAEKGFDNLRPIFRFCCALAGVVAQLVERLNGIQEVRGSNPLGSTSLRPERSGGRRLPRRSKAQAGWDDIQSLASARQAGFHFMMQFFYVYILQCQEDPGRFYTGITEDLRARLSKHNSGEVSHTAKFRPWRVKTAIAFTDHRRAVEFERYLKTASGRAFAKKRL